MPNRAFLGVVASKAAATGCEPDCRGKKTDVRGFVRGWKRRGLASVRTRLALDTRSSSEVRLKMLYFIKSRGNGQQIG
jgi:hypothetical protein